MIIQISNIRMRTKITLIVFWASIVVFIIAESLTIKGEYIRHKLKLTDLTICSAQLMSDYCGLILSNNSPEKVKLGANNFSRLPFIYDAIVIDTTGAILAEYHKSKDTIVNKLPSSKTKLQTYNKGVFQIIIPITYDNKNFGKLYVRSFFNPRPLLNNLLQWTIIIVLIQILFAFFIIYLFHKYISNPLQYLKDITRKIITEKNYSIRIEKNSFDEIGELYDEFNNLLDAVDFQGQKSSTAETKLFESNERYKALVDNIPGVVFRLEYTDKWNVELVGEGVRELSDGYPVSHFVGKDILEMSHILAPEFQQIFFHRTTESIGVNREFESIYKIITKIGHQKWILMRGRFVHHPDTKLTTIDGILFDQTDKLETQNLLKTTEKRYHDLFDNLNDAAFLIEIDTDVIVETNIEGEKLLGLRSVDIVDKIQMKLLCKIVESLNIEAKDKTNEQSTLLDYYSEIVQSSGKIIPVHVRSSIVTIGEKNHMLCLIRDISQQKEYEENLKKAKIKAEESDNLKSMFLSNMSHEIRTPLNGFIGFSKLILSSKSEEETKSYLSIIEGCGKQLLRIIDDILDVSRIETGQMTFYNEDFSLNALLDEIKNIIEEQKIRTNKKNISIILNKGLYNENDIIFADRHRLYQVIVNIAGNAVKFTNEGEVTISYKPQNDDYLLFKISDTGIGINPDKYRMIFNRFTQANSSIAPKYGGSGLGLAIAKGIVDLMGGDIWIESQEGIGSDFYFTIKNNKKKKVSLISN